MNWFKKIEEKYPKGWELYRQNDKLYGTHNVNYNSHRIFYDFFDEQGIWIEICPPTSLDEGLNGFEADIHLSNDSFMVDGIFNSRTEAEEQAFIRAFEILEGKL